MFDIYEPIFIFNYWPWIWGVSFLLILGVGYYVYKRKINQKNEISKTLLPQKSPRTEALENLQIAWDSYEKSQDVKTYYSRCSEIFRLFLQRHWNVTTIDKTTSEIFSALRKNNVDRRICLEVRDIFSECDLVKFAKFQPGHVEALKLFDHLKNFIFTHSPEDLLEKTKNLDSLKTDTK